MTVFDLDSSKAPEAQACLVKSLDDERAYDDRYLKGYSSCDPVAGMFLLRILFASCGICETT